MSRQILEYHPVTGLRFVPDLRARVPSEAGGYLVKTNSTGFRSEREFEAARSAGLRRVLLFGDSFTAGDGVSNRDRYSDVLERLIPSLEIYNFGLPASGTDQQYLAYREFGHSIPTDLLVIAPLVENILRVSSHYRRFVDDQGKELCFAKPYYLLNSDELVLHHVPVPPAAFPEEELPANERGAVYEGGRFPRVRHIINTLGVKDLALRISHYQPVPEYDDPQSPQWRLMRAILVKWIGEHDGPVLLVPIPLYHHIEEISSSNAYVARFTELASEMGCAFHNMLPELLRYSQAERRAFRFERDVHPTPSGHAAIAKALEPTISRMLSSLQTR